MRRADRLFQIIQILRRRSVTTAARLAEELEVSERTVYRDVNDLVCSGVPIIGEAGVGYALSKDYDMPPLMFSAEELEALVLGARIVRSWSDEGLAGAAEDALAKIKAVLPGHLKRKMSDSALFAHNFEPSKRVFEAMGALRPAIRDKRKIALEYADISDRATKRTVRPLCLTFFSPSWMLTGWCELRGGFRNFRVDRIAGMKLLDEFFVDEPGKSLSDFFRSLEE